MAMPNQPAHLVGPDTSNTAPVVATIFPAGQVVVSSTQPGVHQGQSNANSSVNGHPESIPPPGEQKMPQSTQVPANITFPSPTPPQNREDAVSNSPHLHPLQHAQQHVQQQNLAQQNSQQQDQTQLQKDHQQKSSHLSSEQVQHEAQQDSQPSQLPNSPKDQHVPESTEPTIIDTEDNTMHDITHDTNEDADGEPEELQEVEELQEREAKRQRIASPEPPKDDLDDEAVLALAAHNNSTDHFDSEYVFSTCVCRQNH